MIKYRFKKVLVNDVRIVKALFTLMTFVLIGIARLLSESAKSTETKEEGEHLSDLSGGVLNYRTGKLDDGTDPYGWYEDD